MISIPEPPSGRFEGDSHLFPVRVYYEDTDLSGIVYHANYLRWFERARSDMLRLLDIDQRAAIEAGDGAYAVSELALRYRSPARLDDAVLIQSDVVELRGASVRLVQRAFRKDCLLCDATVRVGFVAPDGRPRRQPDSWRAAFKMIITQGNPE
ncbi:YbgC/FadM family acyl-CoA thioesterase [Altericroceibacterium spongiae]|uniref:YbgC/FadM family acyl-CoA thioesterase n=1 Tax=Altericroceibacterium spongiae TaxID=2320269 RepID=A0A420ELW7_9SPHN|nr:YbgC/FadM family acyl-CoA thioesterase [Altericroceibacterium spongiae]RKF21678.1 YbgC/FadM family acyl-CoA thioesterase [Altericroceibacterium spongiae]